METSQPADAEDAPDALDDLWRVVEERWDDAKVHDLFVQACFERSRLDEAARRYKAQADRPERSVVADKRLQSVVFLASQALEQDRSPPVKKDNRWLVVAAALVCIGSIAVLVYALTR